MKSNSLNMRFQPGDVVQHFKRETLDPDAFAQNKYLYRIVGALHMLNVTLQAEVE